MSRLAKVRASLATSLFKAANRLNGSLKKRHIYAGAAVNRLMADWIWGPVSAQHELLDLRTLRDRGRELQRDNAYAGRYVDLATENIISDSGLRLQAMTYTGNEPDDAVNDTIEAAWAAFGTREVCDVQGQLDLIDLQNRVVEGWKGGDGEALIQIVRGRGAHGVQFLLLDPDQLDEQHWRARVQVDRDGPDVNAIIAGVEVDRVGKPVAYHLFVGHPSDPQGRRDRQRVPAADIIHIFDARRQGQTRGITRFARVMKQMRHLGGIEEAVLVNMRASACKMGFLVPGEGADPITDQKGQPVVSLEASPGTIDVLPANHTFADWDPNQPTSSYREVIHESLYAIAAGLNVAFTSLTGNLTAANYGSQRGGLLSERRGWRRDQHFLARHLMTRLFDAWLPEAMLRGVLRLPRENPALYRAHEWLFPGWPWIDPAKDVQAGLAEVRAGLNSLTALAASRGVEFEVVLAQRRREMRLAQQYGVEIDLSSAGNSQGATNDGNSDTEAGTGTANEADAGAADRDRAAPLRLARAR